MSATIAEQFVELNPALMHRLTVDQVHRMLDAGILRDGDPIELIDGLLIRKDRSDAGGDPMIHGPRHAVTVRRLQLLSPQFVPFGLQLISQLPIALSALSEPEPDATVIHAESGALAHGHPTAKEIVLVIEVADSSLKHDRLTKGRLYAQAGIPTYWIVNLPDSVIEIYEQPNLKTGIYQSQNVVGKNETLQLALPGGNSLKIAVMEILP